MLIHNPILISYDDVVPQFYSEFGNIMDIFCYLPKIYNYMDVYYKTGRKLKMTKQLKLRLMRFNPSNYISE